MGNALKDKTCFNVVTTGGRREAYDPKWHNNFTIRQLLAPIEQTANLCKMIYLPPYVVHGTHSITSESVKQHRNELHSILHDLQHEKLNLNEIRTWDYFNDFYQKFQKEKQTT